MDFILSITVNHIYLKLIGRCFVVIEQNVKWCCYMENKCYKKDSDLILRKLKVQSYITREYGKINCDVKSEQLTIFDYNLRDSIAI